MKKIQLLGLAALLAFASCKKNDVTTEAQTTGVSKSQEAQLSTWTAVQNWTTTEGNSQGSISDNNISAAIASQGLVLVYANTKSTPVLLPAQVGKTNYYYQVENGSIQINASKTDASFDKSQQFSYIILSKEQLQKLEEKGFSKLQLMAMDYSNVKQLNK